MDVPPRALLFDLGGVLIDIDFGRALHFWAQRAHTEPALLQQRFRFDGSYEGHERGELSSSEYFALLRSQLGVDLTIEDLVAGWNDIYVGVVPGMPELLARASRHVPLYAFTNTNPSHLAAWSSLFAEEVVVFTSVFVSSDLGHRKPEPSAYREVARRMGTELHEVLFFDDSPANVDGARSVGMPAVLVESAADVERALARIGYL
jgi:HAD superfamily hydrolase (TIGR01509 family)